MKVYPTRRCFDDAAEIMLAMAQADPEPVFDHEVLVVHGIVESNEPGKEGDPISHGWVEYKEFVFFRGIINGETMELRASRREFYKDCQVKELIRYTIEEVIENNERHGTTGPWIEHYMQHATRI